MHFNILCSVLSVEMVFLVQTKMNTDTLFLYTCQSNPLMQFILPAHVIIRCSLAFIVDVLYNCFPVSVEICNWKQLSVMNCWYCFKSLSFSPVWAFMLQNKLWIFDMPLKAFSAGLEDSTVTRCIFVGKEKERTLQNILNIIETCLSISMTSIVTSMKDCFFSPQLHIHSRWNFQSNFV